MRLGDALLVSVVGELIKLGSFSEFQRHSRYRILTQTDMQVAIDAAKNAGEQVQGLASQAA